MIYKKFKDLELSALGLGTMRFPTVDGDDSKIDEAATAEMFEYAIQNGINYFDTAWGYHRGQSELVTGKMLSKYPRDKFYLASKFPGYDLKNMENIEEIFERQLEKCRVEYFDFYLVHNVCEKNIDSYTDPKYGLYEYLLRQKEDGRIKHLGFSVHGSYDVTKRFLSVYGDAMEFCQIQLNWIDYDFQSAKDKLTLLSEWGIPVWVMEPLRGGKLAVLDKKYEDRLRALKPEMKVPEWSFRYLQSFEQVKVTLSGMSNMDQLKENIRTFEKDEPLTESERQTLYSIARDMVESVPCTACRYCTEKCPMQLDIPELIKLYNEHSFTEDGFIAPMALSAMPESKRPSACIGCRACEQVCPQMIKISEVFSDFVEKLK